MAERTMVTRWKSVVDPSVRKSSKEVGDEAEKTSRRSTAAWAGVGAAVGTLAGTALVRAGEAAIDFAKDSFRAASDLKEAVNVTGLAFGKHAPKLESFFKGAAGNIGMSETAARSAAAGVGGLLQNMGMGQAETVGWSKKLLQLSADMGSAFNTDPVQAIEAIGAGLRGESEPLRKYNVMLSDAKLKQEAMSMGLYSGKGALDDNAKAQAALSLIMKQTTSVQGDFANTADGAANAARIQAAKVEDLKAKFADGLLPAQEAWYGFMNDKALPALSDFADNLGAGAKWVQENAGALTGLGITVGILAVAYGVLAAAQAAQAAGGFTTWIMGVAKATRAWAVVQGFLNVVMSANPIALVVIAIAALVAGIVYAYQNCETFRKVVDDSFAAIAAAGRWLWNNALRPVVQFIVRGFAWVVDGIAGMLDALGDVPGFGWAKDAANGLRGMAKSARDAADSMEGIPDPKVDTRGSQTEIDRLNTKIKSLKGKVVEAKAKGDTSEVERLRKKIAEIKSKRVQIEANVKKTGVTTISLQKVSAGSLAVRWEANGGVYPPGVRRFANGGWAEDHRAQIAPAGAWRVWAEPETGGEAYLPLSPAKRAQTVPMWWETGRRLGVVEHYAAGGVTGSSSPATGSTLAEEITDAIDRQTTKLARLIPDRIAESLRQAGDRPRLSVGAIR